MVETQCHQDVLVPGYQLLKRVLNFTLLMASSRAHALGEAEPVEVLEVALTELVWQEVEVRMSQLGRNQTSEVLLVSL